LNFREGRKDPQKSVSNNRKENRKAG